MSEIQIMPRERESHWYHVNGDPCHEVPKAKGGGMRPTTVTDARKLNLLPSVTNILGVKAKPQLEAWKIDQGILAALTIQRIDGESEEAFRARIAADAMAETRKAADFGTLIHEQMEIYAKHGAFTATGELLDHVAPFEKFWKTHIEEVIGIEQKVVNTEIGYAGRLDLHCIMRGVGRAVIDFKSQRLKGKDKPVFYREWGMQLSAYGDCLREPGEPLPHLFSLVIPSDQHGPFFLQRWDNPMDDLDAFHSCHHLWCWEKQYTPKF